MNQWRHPGLVILTIAICFAWLPLHAQAQSATEDQIKAAYLFNFAKFVEWPAEAFAKSDSPMNFCALRRSRVAYELNASMRDRSINGHPFTIKEIRGPEESRDCHMVFLTTDSRREQEKFVAAVKGLPILLVGGVAGFARTGGMIDFFVDEGKLILEINVSAAESSHLKISSRLLALARIVPSEKRQQ